MRRRATELLPQILLTLLSIIQALALELLWTRIFESDYLFEGGLVALAGWLQFSAITLGVILIWLTYISQVMRFVWMPRTRDSIFPFAIGLLEFVLIQTAGPEHPALWLVWMAVVFALATFVSNDIYVHASRERGDSIESFELSGARDRWGGAAVAVFHLLLAAAVFVAGGYGVVAALCFALVNLFLLVQMRVVHLYFERAMAEPASEGESRPEDSE